MAVDLLSKQIKGEKMQSRAGANPIETFYAAWRCRIKQLKC